MDWTRPIGRRSLFKAAGAGAAAYLLSGCAPSTPVPGAPPGSTPAAAGAAASSQGSQGRTVRLAAVQGQGLFEAPNPFGSRTGPGAQQASYVFDSLLWRDSSVDPIPWLAEKWTSSPDSMEWAFTLRAGVKFQDGQSLTAEDVVFSYHYLPEYTTTYYGSIPELISEIKAPDERTVSMKLREPFAPFLNSVAGSTPILPRHIWADVKDPLKFTDPKAYLGSGPYRLAGMNESDSSFLFVANESFFLGKPYVRRLEFISVGDDLLALKAGKLDVASPTAASGLTNEALAPFRSDPRYAIVEAPGEGVTALYFNHSHGAPYSDPRFRRALFHAIDRQEIIDRVLSGNGQPGSPGYLPSCNPFATNDVEQYPFDPARARLLLDQAGYQERDGQRRKPDGSPLVIPLLFGAPMVRVAEILRAQLSQVGVKIDLRSSDAGTASQQQGAGNYDAALVTYGGLGGDPDTHLVRIFGSPPQAKHWQKCWGYSNPELIRLIGEQRRTMDPERRKTLIHQAQRIISQDVPIIHLYYPTRFIIYVPAVFDAWYFTPMSNPLAMNKHFFVTGQKTGLSIRQG